MKNAMQLKASIKKIAMENKISAQLVMQNYMLERLLERISLSSYNKKIILKGGLLIASMVGLQSRATMDMDATVRNFPVNATSVREMFDNIIQTPVNDGINFTLNQISKIREGDEYDGYRVSLTAHFAPMQISLKLDITTGDRITPAAVEYQYPLMFEDRVLNIWCYNLETILAEKLETIISRGDQNTRPRDFYDVFILLKLRSAKLNSHHLHDALLATVQKRNSSNVMKQYKKIMRQVQNSIVMQQHWRKYQKEYEYAREVDFFKTCEVIMKILDYVI